MISKRLKSVSRYEIPSFFFKETNGDKIRIVIWMSDLSKIKKIFYKLISISPPHLEVLLKTRKEDNFEEIERYHGYVSKNALIKAIKKNARYIFQDGSNQICVKNRVKNEYFILDERSIIYVYPEQGDEKFINLVLKFGLQERESGDLIFNTPHWHVQLKDSKNFKNQLILALKLQQVNG